MPVRLFRVEPLRGRLVPTSHWLLVARASAALESHPDELLRIPVAHQAELFALPTESGVGPEERLEQARRVLDWWPPELLLEASRIEVPWHLLYEPTRWDDVEHREVWKFVDAYRQTRGRWPSVGALRERFGRRHNHPVRVPPGQSELL
jgi:hypothetical protein